MKKKLLAVAAICAASSSWAGGMGEPVEPSMVAPVPAHNWGGAYIGLSFGIPTQDNNWAERGIGAESGADSWGGGFYGLTGGMDWQSGSLVYGFSVSAMGGSIDASSTTTNFGCGGVTCDTEVSNYYSLRGRVGKAMGSNMIYATAGIASGEAEASAEGFGVLGSDRLSGWVAGVGVEHALNDKLSLGVEYTYTDLDRLEIPTACGVECYSDVNFGLITLGANYHW